MRRLRLLFLILSVCAAFAQDSADRVITEALESSPLETNLRRLTDEVGGRVPALRPCRRRLTGVLTPSNPLEPTAFTPKTSPFRSPGRKANTEATVSVQHGEKQVTQFKLRAVSIAWAPALTPRRHVRVIDVGQGSPEEFTQVGDVAGALLMVHSEEMKTWDDLFAEYLRAPGIIDRAVKAKSVAIAFQSTRPSDLLYRHANSSEGELDRLPMLLVAREDVGRMARLLASGDSLFADVSIPNRVGGPMTAANVVAELRGGEKPDEYVVLGAHLDSWELGTGALDNGCNAALVIDALRAIKASGVKPRRSIRFVLFSGEEEGMVGSRAYTVAHMAELDKIAGVVIFDSGIGRVTGFSLGGRRDVVDASTALVAPLKQFEATTLTTDASWGTDNFDFMLQGVPTFVANQDEYNYLLNYHAMSDTLDKVDLVQLKKHVAEGAALTFAIANASASARCSPQSRAD